MTDIKWEPEEIPPELVPIYEDYLGNGMKKLRKLAWGVCGTYLQNGNVNENEFMSMANWTFWKAIKRYDPSRNDNFEAYLVICLKKKFSTVFGHIKKRANVTVSTQTTPIESATQEDLGIEETKLVSDDLTEDCINRYALSDGAFNYVNSFCGIYRAVLELIMDGYTEDQIMEILHLTRRQYGDCMAKLRSSKHTLLMNT